MLYCMIYIYIYILNYYLDIYWIRFCLFINSSHPSPFTTWRYLSCVPDSFVSREHGSPLSPGNRKQCS